MADAKPFPPPMSDDEKRAVILEDRKTRRATRQERFDDITSRSRVSANNALMLVKLGNEAAADAVHAATGFASEIEGVRRQVLDPDPAEAAALADEAAKCQTAAAEAYRALVG